MKPSYVPEKHVPLTLMILELNGLLDSGNYDGITPAEVAAHLDDGSIFDYLRERVGADADFSLLLEGGPYPGFAAFYVAALRDLNGAYSSGRKWGVSHRGICLLLAWTNEIIQQGHGWRPLGEEDARLPGARQDGPPPM